MKKFLASALLLAAVSGNAFAGEANPKVLRAGAARVKAKVDSVIVKMGGHAVTEADAQILNFLYRSSTALEQTIDYLDLGDIAWQNGDTDGYLNNFALGCNRVAAARAQLSNAGRRALYINSTFPDSVFLYDQATDIKDTRDTAYCPI